MICLCLMVKNHAATILQCLQSVTSLVKSALVIDYGSTDGTRQIITSWAKQHTVAVTVVDKVWLPHHPDNTHVTSLFDHARTTYPDSTYFLYLDPDEVLLDLTALRQDLVSQAPGYTFVVHVSTLPLKYSSLKLVRADIPLSVEGVQLSYLKLDNAVMSSCNIHKIYRHQIP